MFKCLTQEELERLVRVAKILSAFPPSFCICPFGPRDIGTVFASGPKCGSKAYLLKQLTKTTKQNKQNKTKLLQRGKGPVPCRS